MSLASAPPLCTRSSTASTPAPPPTATGSGIILDYLANVPERFRGWYELNPFSPMLESFRDVLLLGQFPSLTRLGAATLFAVGFLVVGFAFFTLREPLFAKLN